MGRLNKQSKNIVFGIILALFVGLFLRVPNTFAASTGVSTAEELTSYFASGGNIRLLNDITLEANTFVRGNTTLNLNGHVLDLGSYALTPYQATLTVEDNTEEQSGKITSTAAFTIQVGGSNVEGGLVLNSGTIDCKGTYGIRNYGDTTINGGTITAADFTIYNQGNSLVINGGTIYTPTGTAVGVYTEGASFVMNGGLVKTDADDVAIRLARPNTSFTMNGGTVEALYGDVETRNGGSAVVGFKYTEITINDGTLTSFGNTILGNGSDSGDSEGTAAVFNINGGYIHSTNGAGIYAPQVQGVTNVTGGTIIGQTGIEVRAGTLSVSGGTIIGEGEYNVVSGKSGLSTWGAAISVAQHTTAQPIIVNITGGSFAAEVPISNANPQDFDPSVLEQVDIQIKGGEYDGEDLETVVNNIPRGYIDVDETPSGGKIAVVQVNPLGYYLSASSSGSIDIMGLNGEVTSDYSDIGVLSNCRAGYDLVMSTTGSSNTLYPNGDMSAENYFSPVESDTPLLSTSNSWGYFMSNDESYEPSENDLFNPVPTSSDPVALKTAAGTATDEDIKDKFRLHFGANISRTMGLGEYRLPRDVSGNSGGIVYQLTANPACTDTPVEVNFNENTDGEGGSEDEVIVDNMPNYMNNSIQFEDDVAVTITLSEMVPVRDDYAFVEWNTEPDGSGHSYQPDDVVEIGNNTEEGQLVGVVTLYAIWTDGCAGATVCYDGNNASAGTMDNQVGERGVSAKLTPSNFSRDGYGFAGWNTKADGTGENYGPMQVFGFPKVGGTILYANWIESAGDMQTWDGAESMEIGDITALTDTRDGQTYAVAKLADGKVWMIENFRLDPGEADMDILKTNHPTKTFVEQAKNTSSSVNLCGDNNAACFERLLYNANNLNREAPQSPTGNDGVSAWYSYGVMYNWYTATAGNGLYSTTNNTTVSGDICPAGWHLPTGNNGEFVALSDAVVGSSPYDVRLLSAPNNYVRSGEFNKTTAAGEGEYGRYWSSTASENNKAYRFGFNSNTVTPNNTWNKWEAFAVRCMYDGNRIPTEEVTVNLGEHVTSVTIKNDNYGEHVITESGTTIAVAEDIQYALSAEFEDGYTINTWTTTENGQVGDASGVNTTYEVDYGADTLSISAREATITTYILNYDTTPSTDVVASMSGDSYNSSYIFEVTDTIPVVFGKTMIGWTETQGGSTVEYIAGDTVTLVNADPTSITAVTKTLYAVYQDNTCDAGNICYFGNGANAGTMVDQGAASNSSVELIPSNYSRTGYGFAGWIESENGTPYGPNATITTPDLNESSLQLYAKWVASEQEDMQTWTGCSTLQEGSVTALTDSRDGNTYAVAKLGDGKCWMIENLRLDVGKATITAANTNNPTSKFVEDANAEKKPSSSNTMCKTNSSACFDQILYNSKNTDRSAAQSHTSDNGAWYSYGVYYNWYTATAGQGKYETSGNTNVSGDICPAGWHVPTGNTSGEYNNLNTMINNGSTTSDANWRAYPNNFIWSGDYNGTKRTGIYGNTRLWTSTAKDNNTSYRLGLEKTKVTASTNAYNKWDGFAVRCMKNN